VTIERQADRVERELEVLGEGGAGAIVVLRDDRSTIVLCSGEDALGREGDADTIVPLFCLAKPLVAAAVEQAIQDGELSFDDRLGDLITVHKSLDTATVLELLEHRSGIGGPQGVEAGLLGRSHRRELLAEQPLPLAHTTHYSEVLGFEALGWCLEAATGSSIDSLVSQPGVWLGAAAATAIVPSDVWTSTIVSPDGGVYPLLFPLALGALADPNPGFGGYCRPADYLDVVASWLARQGAPRTQQLAFDGAFGRPVSWNRGVCTSLGAELHSENGRLIGHLGFMGSSCVAYDDATGVSVFASLSPIALDVSASRRRLGRIVDAATAPR